MVPGFYKDIEDRSSYSTKIKEQTKKLVIDNSKHCFEVADETDQVSHKALF